MSDLNYKNTAIITTFNPTETVDTSTRTDATGDRMATYIKSKTTGTIKIKQPSNVDDTEHFIVAGSYNAYLIETIYDDSAAGDAIPITDLELIWQRYY